RPASRRELQARLAARPARQNIIPPRWGAALAAGEQGIRGILTISDGVFLRMRGMRMRRLVTLMIAGLAVIELTASTAQTSGAETSGGSSRSTPGQPAGFKPAGSKAAQPGRPALPGDSKVVTFAGYEISVPADWPVYPLAAHPSRCIRFDRHAVYLG